MNPEYTTQFLSTVKSAAPDGGRLSGTNDDPLAVLHQVFDAIVQHDFEKFGTYVSDDVELKISGFGLFDGNWHGRAAVVQASQNNFKMVADQKPEIEGMISQGNTVAILLNESGIVKATEKAYKIRCVQWYTFAGGKIQKIDEIVTNF